MLSLSLNRHLLVFCPPLFGKEKAGQDQLEDYVQLIAAMAN